MRHRTTRRDGRRMFPGNNSLGIPDLIPELCYQSVPAELLTYRAGRHSAETARGKVLSFFTDDYRFACAWNYPRRMAESLVRSRWAAVCEPDFSVWADHPPIEQMHAVYKARWCARYWQECGIPIIPVLNWSDQQSYYFAFDGIPYRCPVVAVEVQTCGSNVEAFNLGLAVACAVVQPAHLLIYGNRIGIEIPKSVEPHWFPTHVDQIQKRRSHGR